DPLLMDTTPSSSKSVVGLATSSSAPSIEVVEREPDFAALREEWEELCTLAGARVYQSFDWQWLWWKHFGHGLALHVVVFRQHGAPARSARPLRLDRARQRSGGQHGDEGDRPVSPPRGLHGADAAYGRVSAAPRSGVGAGVRPSAAVRGATAAVPGPQSFAP